MTNRELNIFYIIALVFLCEMQRHSQVNGFAGGCPKGWRGCVDSSGLVKVVDKQNVDKPIRREGKINHENIFQLNYISNLISKDWKVRYIFKKCKILRRQLYSFRRRLRILIR